VLPPRPACQRSLVDLVLVRALWRRRGAAPAAGMGPPGGPRRAEPTDPRPAGRGIAGTVPRGSTPWARRGMPAPVRARQTL